MAFITWPVTLILYIRRLLAEDINTNTSGPLEIIRLVYILQENVMHTDQHSESPDVYGTDIILVLPVAGIAQLPSKCQRQKKIARKLVSGSCPENMATPVSMSATIS